ncbi:MAG: hypothetical protein ACR2KQ_10290 [Actinomycetota bacterium]
MEPEISARSVPDGVERHHFGYHWEQRFPEVSVLRVGEGFSIHSAKGEGSFWLINDEGTLADFLPEGDPLLSQLVTLKRYDDRGRWERAVEMVIADARRTNPNYDEDLARWREYSRSPETETE